MPFFPRFIWFNRMRQENRARENTVEIPKRKPGLSRRPWREIQPIKEMK